jgi:hypothetical protein
MVGFSLVASFVASNTMRNFTEERLLSSLPTGYLMLTNTGNNKFKYKEKVNVL